MNEFQHVCYRVGDIDRSLAFYAALGFAEQKRYEFSATETKLVLGIGSDEPRIGLTYVTGVDGWELGTGFNHVAMTVDDLAATLAALAELGHEPESPPFQPRPGGSTIAFVADPDGYRFELIEKP